MFFGIRTIRVNALYWYFRDGALKLRTFLYEIKFRLVKVLLRVAQRIYMRSNIHFNLLRYIIRTRLNMFNDHHVLKN